MTSIVAISAASQGVKANRQGQAEHAFSVTNTTSGRIGIGIRIMVEPPAQASWFSIDGNDTRDLATNETDQVVVKAKFPADAKPGEYKVRLQVYSTERGRAGEDFTTGPTVSIEQLPPTDDGNGTQEESKKFQWWIPAVAVAAVLVLGGVAAWVFWPSGGVEMPELVDNLTVDQARQALQDVGLSNIKEEAMETADVAPGFVVKQDPSAGAKVAKDAKVTLWVAKPPGAVTVAVPNVVSLPIQSARQKLADAGLRVRENPPVATLDVKAGHVKSQSPEATSSPVAPNTVVTLTVAGDSVKVPKVKGEPLAAAISKMTAAKLLVKVMGDQDKLNQGVVSTSPPEGQPVLVGSEVTIRMPGQIVWIPVNKFPVQVLKQLKTRGIQLPEDN